MSAEPAESGLPGAPGRGELRRRLKAVGRGVVVLSLTSALVGGLAGVLWQRVTVLPEYLVRADGSASTTERGLTQFIAADASYTLLGLLGGLLLGLAWWAVLGPRRGRVGLGWPVVIVASGAALLAGLCCWQVGEALGVQQFSQRLSAATAGEMVPIDFGLRSPVAVVVWVLGTATTFVGLGAVLPDSGRQ